MLCINSVHYS